jgi:hypothetical protein
VVTAPVLEAVPAPALCFTDGRLAMPADPRLHIDLGGTRAVIAGDRSRSAELAFTYEGASKTTTPLANGELRRQIGLKLRAQDTCNVVYVMWAISPKPGVFVSVKRNPGQSKHKECLEHGYESPVPEIRAEAAQVEPGVPHVLRADMDGDSLRVTADGVVAWSGRLPREAFVFDGGVGFRSDNGKFDFELRVPDGSHASICPR